MPIGTGAEVLETTPGRDFVADPSTFNSLTRPNITPFATIADPGAGGVVRATVPQVGVLGMIRATFRGTMSVATAAVTPTDRWPHGLISDVQVSLNGQDKLFSCDGCDLHVLRFARNPAYTESVDVFPGALGGGTSIAIGTYDLELSWEIPIAMDMTSLVGALYMQSSATNLTVALGRAGLAELVNTPANVAMSGTWYFETSTFAVPRDSKSQLVVPDLTRMHNFTGLDLPVTNVGEVRFPLIRQSGQLTRLFISGRTGTTTPWGWHPGTTANRRMAALRVEYGGNERPWVFDPVSSLLRRNNVEFGGVLPYNRICIDLVRTNPARDALVMLGVTELACVATQGPSITPGAGASMRLVQETLYQAG